MALRVKNIQQGFVDATGFHPIRSSADYDDERTGDNYEPRPRKRATKKRKPATKKRATKKAAKRKVTAKRKPARKANPALKKRKTTAKRKRVSNPLPIGLNWTKAYIRRNEDGDLQALLPLPHLTKKRK